MPTRLRRGLRFAGKSAWYGFAVAALLLALVVGSVTRGLGWLESNPARVATWLGAKANQPIAFDGLKAEWTRRGPLLRLSGLRIGPGGEAIPMGQAEVLVAPYTGWLPGRRMTELRLHGLVLTLERNADGEWHVQGLPGQSSGRDPLRQLEALGELQVIGGRLRIIAPSSGIDLVVPRIDLRVQVDGERVRAGIRAWPGADAAPLTGSLDFHRKRGDGRFFAGGRKLDFAGWSELLRWQGVAVVAGQGRAQTWLELRGHRVAAVTSVGDLEDVVLAAVDPTPGAMQEVRLERLQQRTRFVRDAAGWSLQLPELAFHQAGREIRMDGLRMQHDGSRWSAEAPRLPLGPLLSIADLSDALPTPLRHWLGRARPQGLLEDLSARGEGERLSFVEARIRGAGFRPVGHSPGLTGLAGRLSGDHDGLALALDPASALEFDWPSGFGVKHPLRAEGTVALWREGEGVRLGTGHLQLQGSDYRADARGGLWFQNDGTRPWIDIAANIAGAEVPVAKKFWIRHLMPREAVSWLDMALVGGRIREGRAIVSGDLDDWPFDRRNGRFEARAEIENGQLRFQEDWPPIVGASLQASFIGAGMRVTGSGELGGVQIESITAEIDDFDAATLDIDARGRGDAGGFLRVLRESPLERTLGETLSRVGAAGPARATFTLRQPLHRNGPPQRIAGTVELEGATLSERELALAFTGVRGSARYDGHGFRADALSVVHEGLPGKLALRAGAPHVDDRRHAFEADLSASMDAARLLDRVPDLAWLKPHVQGRSEWNVAVALPAGGNTASARPSRVVLSSTLAGTAIGLPAPLAKPSAESLPTTIRIPLPVESGEVEVALGRRLAVRARSHGGRTGVRATLGSAVADGAPPAQGIVVGGRAAEIDALDWIAFAGGGAGGASSGPLRVDVQTAQLRMLGQRFGPTRLQLVPVGGDTRVQVEGAGIAGQVLVPAADGATISGRFSRAAIEIGKGAATPVRVNAATPARTDDIDPAKLPPLDITIDELKFNGRVAGRATLKTRPVAAGMQVEAISLQGAGHDLRASGAWTGRGGDMRSRLEARVESRDFGRMLSTFGLDGQMKGGEGRMSLALSWPGSPMAFAPARVEGRLDGLVKDGQLVELEPGAGRLLGLLSVARLPQRLSLDFRDFFDKGFAFDRMEGKVRFADGRARSEGILIEGPAASIDIGGSADLAAQRFDQTIEVKPRTGNLLTVAGALAGGPVGAAVGAVANAVLKRPLSEVGAKTYRVTGPWDAPKVEVVQRGRAPLAENGTPP